MNNVSKDLTGSRGITRAWAVPTAICVVLAAVGWLLLLERGAARSGGAGEELTLYVSTNGDDTAAGTVDAPLASLEAARDRVRELRREKGERKTIVFIEEGVYERNKTFKLTAEDSGTAGAPVIYRGATAALDGAEEPVRLIGGRLLESFEPVTDENVPSRLPSVARGHVVRADLQAEGIRDMGRLARRGFTLGGPVAAMELFIDGRPMPLARWPNVGWATVDSIPSSDAQGVEARTIGFQHERMERWAEASEPWAFGYWYHGWADEHTPIAEVDAQNGRLTFGAEHLYGYRKNQRFYVYNILEELDSPGQWYADRETGVLYLWPPEGVRIEETEVMVSLLEEPLISTRNASHVRFEQLVLEGTRGSGVTIRDGENVQVVRSVIRNIGRDGVNIRDGREHSVVSSDLYHLAERGIHLVGGDRQTLEPAGHRAVNNHIHHFSRWARTYRAAIQMSGVGHVAEHNLIHDGPHLAINFGGNDHRIAFNEIHHVLTETDDAGALYIGRDWTGRGHVIEGNFIRHSGSHHARDHDRGVGLEKVEENVVYGPVASHGTSLIYLDDMASGVTIRGNLLHDGGRTILIGGGRDNNVEGNIIIGGDRGVRMDGRGLAWASELAKPDGRWGIWDRLKAVPFDQPPYSDRYPGLAELPDNEPYAPVGNRIFGNIILDAVSPLHFLHNVEDYAEQKDNRILTGRVQDPAALTRQEILELAGQLKSSRPTTLSALSLDRIGLNRTER